MLKRTQKLPIVTTSIKTTLYKGFFGLKALESGEVSQKQIETVRKLISPFVKKKLKFFLRIKPNFIKTAKPFGSRMGSGKGLSTITFSKVRRGQILFELSTKHFKVPNLILKKIHSKFGIKTVFITKGL